MTSDRRPNHARSSEGFHHEPVMVEEIVELFAPVPAGVLVDATVGGGGHARALLQSRADLDLVGLDQDGQALEAAAEHLAPFADRITLRRERFDHLGETLEDLGRRLVSGVLFDLGVSSPQLDLVERGFSYRHEGPLDMRMDQRRRLTAEEVVNRYDVEQLADVIRGYGDERHATRIARAIVAARPVQTTAELAEVVRDAVPAATRRQGPHPARRTFQALRIEVNRELQILPDALHQALEVLMAGGRCAALAYHSGEDRIVKEVFLEAAGVTEEQPPGFPVDVRRPGSVRLLWRGARRPRAGEVRANPRAESARLRAVEKLGGQQETGPTSTGAALDNGERG